jgi:hypothetical protein
MNPTLIHRLALIGVTVTGASACVYLAADSASRVALEQIKLGTGRRRIAENVTLRCDGVQ